LVSITDSLENFYLFASEDESSPVFAQAAMMWNAARKSLEKAGINIICDQGIPVDFKLHSPERIGSDSNLPDGYVLSILESGYIYNGTVIRRASVTVNKKGETP
jgi:molecular chaperone GrpE